MIYKKPKHQIIKERGGRCFYCGSAERLELHHCLYHRKKGLSQLDDEINLMVICNKCHTEKGHGYMEKVRFFETQLERYGIESIEAWHDSIPIKKQNSEITMLIENSKGD